MVQIGPAINYPWFFRPPGKEEISLQNKKKFATFWLQKVDEPSLSPKITTHHLSPHNENYFLIFVFIL